jgi:hypothetical protein
MSIRARIYKNNNKKLFGGNMTYGGKTRLITAIIIVVFLFIFLGYFIGLKNAYDIIDNFSPFKAFIIAGIIMLIFGLSERKWGGFLYTFVVLIFVLLSFKK